MRSQALLEPRLNTGLQTLQIVHLLINRLLRPIDDAAEGTEHLFKWESGDSFQGVEDRMDILVVSQISQMLTNKEVSGKEPSFVRLVKADMVIGMPGCGNHEKTEFRTSNF